MTKPWVSSGKASLDPMKAPDGGNYVRFSKISDGLQAAKELLLSTAYSNLPVDEALAKWSSGGYKAATLRLPQLGSKKVSELTGAELSQLVDRMAFHESGFRAN